MDASQGATASGRDQGGVLGCPSCCRRCRDWQPIDPTSDKCCKSTAGNRIKEEYAVNPNGLCCPANWCRTPASDLVETPHRVVQGWLGLWQPQPQRRYGWRAGQKGWLHTFSTSSLRIPSAKRIGAYLHGLRQQTTVSTSTMESRKSSGRLTPDCLRSAWGHTLEAARSQKRKGCPRHTEPLGSRWRFTPPFIASGVAMLSLRPVGTLAGAGLHPPLLLPHPVRRCWMSGVPMYVLTHCCCCVAKTRLLAIISECPRARELCFLCKRLSRRVSWWLSASVASALQASILPAPCSHVCVCACT